MGELQPAASDVGVIGREQRDVRGVVDRACPPWSPPARPRSPGRRGPAPAPARATAPAADRAITDRVGREPCNLGSELNSRPGSTSDPGSPSTAPRSTGRCRADGHRRVLRQTARLSARDRHSAPCARRLEAVQRRVRGLARGGILPGGLAELRRRAFDVEDVVDDLERQAELAPRRDRSRPPVRRCRRP